MKLVTFSTGGSENAGVLMKDGAHVLPLKAACLSKPFASLLTFIKEHRDTDLARLRELAEGPPPSDALSLSELRLLAPIPAPKNDIYCLGLNYLDHVSEGDKSGPANAGKPEHAVYFTKRAACVIGPESEIPSHGEFTSAVDYEVEFAIVLGKGGRNIPEGSAREHIFGYTIINDISARDLQKRHNQWFLGKNLDGFCPMGPWLVTADEFGYPAEVALRSRVNGEPRQNGHSENMLFPPAHVIAELSRGITLMPGDIIATGTPAGVGMGFDPPRYLSPGDVVECEIEGIGVLRNPVGK